MVSLTTSGTLEFAAEVDWLQWVAPEDDDPGKDQAQSGHVYGLADTDDDGEEDENTVAREDERLNIPPGPQDSGPPSEPPPDPKPTGKSY
ncbi:MAG TPA: hypothetical protein VGT44_06550 [Ktedonobacteraceae bacterium]|nr:hypothetical protein [Ktedonobacteraceae bacterium]